MLVKIVIIIPSSKCSAIGHLATTSRCGGPTYSYTMYSSSITPTERRYCLLLEVLTKVYGLSSDRLYVTYFEGDPQAGLEPDLEARQFWLDVGVAEDHILTGNAKDNFWGMFRHL